MKEERLQANCVFWLWNTYPETRGLFVLVNNNPLNAIDGARKKALGLISGVSDTVFFWKGRTYFIEFKNEKGKQSPAQVEFQQKVEHQGFKYNVIRTEEEFRFWMENIIQSHDE